MKPPNPNPPVVYLKSRAIPDAHAERMRQIEMQNQYKITREQKLAKIEQPELPPVCEYEVARNTETPYDFIRYVLNKHHRLYDCNGEKYLDGHRATPSKMREAADAILTAMGKEPVKLWGRK